MTSNRFDSLPRVRVQLVGKDGNAYSILGRWKGAAREQGWPTDAIDEVLLRATSGSYSNLLAVIGKYSDEPADLHDEDGGER